MLRAPEIAETGRDAYNNDPLRQEAGGSLMMKIGEAANRLDRAGAALAKPDDQHVGTAPRSPRPPQLNRRDDDWPSALSGLTPMARAPDAPRREFRCTKADAATDEMPCAPACWANFAMALGSGRLCGHDGTPRQRASAAGELPTRPCRSACVLQKPVQDGQPREHSPRTASGNRIVRPANAFPDGPNWTPRWLRLGPGRSESLVSRVGTPDADRAYARMTESLSWISGFTRQDQRRDKRA